jgi:mono/diheme cytochrome c family protein
MMSKLSRLSLLVIGLLLAACGTIATPEWAANVQETKVAQAATETHLTAIAPTATPTDVPTNTPVPTNPPTPVPPTDVPTTVPPTTPPPTAAPAVSSGAAIAYVGKGDPAKGKVLFQAMQPEAGFACATCHYVDKTDRLIGPGLYKVAEWAAENIKDEKPQDYIHTSIVKPGAYVVKDYPDGLMPQIYAKLFTPDQIEDLVAYVMSLK